MIDQNFYYMIGHFSQYDKCPFLGFTVVLHCAGGVFQVGTAHLHLVSSHLPSSPVHRLALVILVSNI